ncbi:MAG: hypothetical protein KGL01_00515 [Betaproteobacteria bacterium]|nr:hypothetical protein [Betaproteobacteria bacterium]
MVGGSNPLAPTSLISKLSKNKKPVNPAFLFPGEDLLFLKKTEQKVSHFLVADYHLGALGFTGAWVGSTAEVHLYRTALVAAHFGITTLRGE